MAKSRELKSEMLQDAQLSIKDASSIVYGEYRGLDVESMTQLRKTSRSVGVKLKIYKNTIFKTVSYTHLRAHETVLDLVCRLLLEKKLWVDSESVSYTHLTLPTTPYV